MNAAHERIAPGPKGHWLFGNLREFRRDVLELIMRATREFGDVVRFRLGRKVIHLLNHPDHVEHVLQKQCSNFDKNTRSAAFIKSVTGDSLLTSNGKFWQRQRQLIQPTFHRQNIIEFVDQMIAATTAMLDGWSQHAALGQPLDVASEMMRLTYTIVGRTLLSAEVGADAQAIEEAMRIILAHTFARVGNLLNFPDWFPTSDNLRFHAALRSIDRVVYRIIDEHRREPVAGNTDKDLLAMLLGVKDEETGEGMSDRQLRNETITFLLAGHETTANALTWTFYLLARHSEVAQQLREELSNVLGGRPPTLEDLPRLVYLDRVFKESLRLYPPIWIIERRVIADDVVDGFRLPAGSAVVIAPYALHRHPAFWERPEVFEPARFENRPPEAYIPFGAGPRFCVGREFAILEAQLIIALVVQRFHLDLVSGHPVEPLPGITLRARHGLLMTLH